MGEIKEIFDGIATIGRVVLRISSINEKLQDELRINMALIASIDYDNLTRDQILALVDRLEFEEINDYLNFPKKVRRWICNNQVTEILLGKINAKPIEGKYLDEILRTTRIMKAGLENVDLIEVKDPERRFKNMSKYFQISLRLLSRVKKPKAR